MLIRKKATIIPQSIDSVELRTSYENVIKKKETCITNTIQSVNDLLRFMTDLDYVKGMIKDSNLQAQMVQNVAASSEEMVAATEDISNYVQDSSEHMKHTMVDAAKCLQQVEDTFRTIENNINDIFHVKGIMGEVMTETVKINELVGVIKSVADQTNLLSLNASIEAARAGEFGRGFAVVADEIKKLSESTKEQVDIIRKIVDGLNDKINRASGEIERVVINFNGSREAIESATGGIKRVNDTMVAVEDSFTSISANVEEQTATSQEMSSSLQVINEKATLLRSEADRTGKAFFDISQRIDTIRLHAIECAEQIDTATMIKLSITDHLMWKWRVYNMILGYYQIDEKSVGDHHSCRLGCWIASLTSDNVKVKGLLNKIKVPHAEIHKNAKKAVQEFRGNNITKAESLLSEIEKDSNQVVNLLQELSRCSF